MGKRPPFPTLRPIWYVTKQPPKRINAGFPFGLPFELKSKGYRARNSTHTHTHAHSHTHTHPPILLPSRNLICAVRHGVLRSVGKLVCDRFLQVEPDTLKALPHEEAALSETICRACYMSPCRKLISKWQPKGDDLAG